MQCPFVPLSLSSTITLRLLLLHFGSRTIFFTRRSPPSQTNTTWPWPAPFWLSHDHVVIASWSDQYYVARSMGRDYRNRPHTIKVWRIYIYIQMRADYTARLVASAKALGNYVPDNRTFYLFEAIVCRNNISLDTYSLDKLSQFTTVTLILAFLSSVVNENVWPRHFRAISALPLSNDSRRTTDPHNPLCVLHSWYWMPQLHTFWVVFSLWENHSAWLKPEVSWRVQLPATASFFPFFYFCLITSKFIYFQCEAWCSQHLEFMWHKQIQFKSWSSDPFHQCSPASLSTIHSSD